MGGDDNRWPVTEFRCNACVDSGVGGPGVKNGDCDWAPRVSKFEGVIVDGAALSKLWLGTLSEDSSDTGGSKGRAFESEF